MKEQEILQKLIGKVFPVDTFEDEMAKLLHSRKIEWSNLLTDIWDALLLQGNGRQRGYNGLHQQFLYLWLYQYGV